MLSEIVGGLKENDKVYKGICILRQNNKNRMAERKAQLTEEERAEAWETV